MKTCTLILMILTGVTYILAEQLPMPLMTDELPPVKSEKTQTWINYAYETIEKLDNDIQETCPFPRYFRYIWYISLFSVPVYLLCRTIVKIGKKLLFGYINELRFDEPSEKVQ